MAHLVEHTGPKLTPSPEPRMGSAGLGRRKKKEPPQREMAPCSLGGKELTGLPFLFLGDPKRLGPRGQGQGETVSFQGITLSQLPCCLIPWSYFLQRKTKPLPQPGPWAQLPPPLLPSQEHAGTVPSPGSWHSQNYLGRGSNQSPRLPSGGHEGSRMPGISEPALWEEASQFLTVLSSQHLQFRVS